MSQPYQQSVEEILAAMGSSREGLSAAEAAARREKYGPNELQETISRPAWKMLLGQFVEPMILILLGAAVLSFGLGDIVEALAILAIVILFGVLGFIQEYRAEKAMAALKQMACPTVRVRRGGVLQEIPARELVPGDIVQLETGNIVPADLRLIETTKLRVMEAALTGESEAVWKTAAAIPADDLPLHDRKNMAFMGTIVVHGRGVGVVVETGMRTELGRIARLIQQVEEGRTPLQRKLAQVAKQISLAGLAAALVLMGIGLWRGESFPTMLLTAVSLLVAVVPEGLPAVITATLALGGRRMLKRHALIRRLPAVETLGSVTVICTDKTGTLTENRMTVTRLRTLHRDLVWADPPEERSAPPVPDDAEVQPLLWIAALCNDGHLVPEETGRGWRPIGDPTETALLIAAERLGIPTQSLGAKFPRIGEFSFDSDRKRMTTIHRMIPGEDFPLPAVMAAPILAAVKGSPDGLLARATHVVDGASIVPLPEDIRRQFRGENERMAAEGIRVLGMAFRRLEQEPAGSASAEALESDLVFCGLVGMTDPPRAAVPAAIERSHSAGIRTVMITGDHPLTAEAIARHLRLTSDGEPPRLLTGAELARLSDEELAEQAPAVTVYARVSPEDKLRIVTALQNRGQIVAMTGDGVNDSPALRRADIGVAMGITGTDVAKEASKMVLLDDNYATIVAAVEEGRAIFDNLIRFLKFSFGGNLGKVLVMMLAPLAGIHAIALRPLHLLWLNLLTDGLMGLGIGLEPAEPDVMNRPPRRPAAPIFDWAALREMLAMGIFICVSSLALAGIWHRFGLGAGEWQTVLFSAIGFARMGQAWGMRSLTERAFRFGRNRALVGLTALTLILQLGVVYVSPLARAFRLTPLSPEGLGATMALGVAMFVGVHLARRWRQ